MKSKKEDFGVGYGKMRKCNQINCGYWKTRIGCRKCSFCSAKPYIVAEDCPDCYACENVPGACRWADDAEENTETEEVKEKDEEAVIEIKMTRKTK